MKRAQRRTGPTPLADDGSGIRRTSPRPPLVAMRCVLIVHDDAMFRAELLRIVVDAGYEALTASDPQLALAMCVRERPAILLVDIEGEANIGIQLVRLVQFAMRSDAPSCFGCASEGTSPEHFPELAVLLPQPIEPSFIERMIDTFMPQEATE
jgi:two-component SAPR family response regulator